MALRSIFGSGVDKLTNPSGLTTISTSSILNTANNAGTAPMGDKRSAVRRDLGVLLRQARKEAGASLKTAAPRLGVDYTYLSKIENGAVMPSVSLLSRMAKYYSVDSDALFTAADRLPPDVEGILRANK